MNRDEIQRVADGLSEAQRRAVMSATKSPMTGRLVLPTYRDKGRLLNSLKELGIVTGVALNTKGLAVRNYILEQST